MTNSSPQSQKCRAKKKTGKKWLAGKVFITFLLMISLFAVPPASALAGNTEPSLAAAYYRLASGIVDQYGVHADPELNDQGLAYADLIDFDGNGVPELYMIYATDLNGYFAEEIWTYRNGQVIKVYFEEDGEFGLVGDRAVSLARSQGKTYIVYTSSYSSGRGDYPFTNNYFLSDSFLTLVNNQVVEVASALYVWEENEETGEERKTYTITENGKERKVSEQTYRAMLHKYGSDQRKAIVSSAAGDKAFAFDMTDNEQKIQHFLQRLTDDMRAKNLGKNQYPQLSLHEKSKLSSFLFHFTDMVSIDLRHYTDAKVIEYIKGALHDGKFEQRVAHMLRESGEPIEMEIRSDSGESYPWSYYPHSAEAFSETAQSLFGVSLEMKSNDFAIYDDGYFYLPEYAFGGNPETLFPRVHGLYSLGNGLYYAEFEIYAVHFGDMVNADSYRNAFETLTDAEKNVAYPAGRGYAFLHQTPGSPYGWQLIEFKKDGVLPDDQAVAEYKRAWKTRNTPDQWAVPEVKAAVEANLVPANLQGWYGSHITRAEFSRLIMNFLTVKTGKSMDDLLSGHGRMIDYRAFADTDDSMVLAANALGIVNGRGEGTFDPEGLITRQEAAVMLTNAAKLIGIEADGRAVRFSDEQSIAAWARDAVAFVSAAEDRTNGAKIMSGLANNRFGPSETFTRQQAIITVKRLFNVNG